MQLEFINSSAKIYNNEIKETIEQKIGEAAKSLLVAIQTDDLDKVKSIVQKLDELGAAHIYTRQFGLI